MKLYIDVTNLMAVDFLTGIQKVVREVVIRMLRDPGIDVVLLCCAKDDETINLLDNDLFLDYFTNNTGDKNRIITNKITTFEQLEAGSVFFDIDSVWNSHRRRSAILPVLKRHGLKLAVFIHDIIPITYPEYCHEVTAFFFMNYLAAYLQYADIIITSTQTTLDQINALIKQLDLSPITGYVTSLGSDFALSSTKSGHVSKAAKAIVREGKYILCVGTIEPRKNHKLLLDAYDQYLADMGINLVFAGRIGWNVEELSARMKQHPRNGHGFYHLSGQNDATIDYLYRNAYIVAFPTFEEGFGLPMIEAIERDSVLLASNVAVLKEVGGDFCDYFDPNSPQEFAELVESYLHSPSRYNSRKEQMKNYVPVTWDLVTRRMTDALKTLEIKPFAIDTNVKQLVILSARMGMLLETLPFIEHYMRFITEIIVCCPDSEAPSLKENYQGRLKLIVLTDSEILNGNTMPADHTTRNMYLRCLAMKRPELDPVFIISDDDYRPLKPIYLNDYITDNKYISYYCFSLDKWIGTSWNPTSFDRGMKRTADFLQDHHYPCRHYASHMPQIIDKAVFLEMLEKHPGMDSRGYCEWCTYFNYLQYAYPANVISVPYKTMGWPGSPTDWKLEVAPDEYLFENFYEGNYQKNAIFDGFSTVFCENTEQENQKKISLFSQRQKQYQQYQKTFDMYSRIYSSEYRELPTFGILISADGSRISVPKYLVIDQNGFAWIPFEIRTLSTNDDDNHTIDIESYYNDSFGKTFFYAEVVTMPLQDSKFDFPVYGYRLKGDYTYNLRIKSKKEIIHKSFPILVI